jgi:hypothetical protein
VAGTFSSGGSLVLGAWRARAAAALALVLFLGALGTGVVAQEPSSAERAPTTLTERMDRAIDAAIIEAALDPDALRTWVAEQVAVDDRPGVRRGARGALLAMRGSELDRALLLAAMLERAGMPVRFALCDMPTANELSTGQAAAGPADSRPVLAIEYIEEIAAAISDPELRAALYRVAELRSQRLAENEESVRVLAGALRQLPPGGPVAEVADVSSEAAPRRHAWVQMAWGADWRDMDVASATGTPPCEPDSVTDELPPEMGERVRIALWVERRSGGSLTRAEALVHEALLADLATSSIAFAFGEPTGLIERPSIAAGSLSAYTPILLIDGEVVRGTPIALPPADPRIGEVIGERIDEVVDALDSSAAPEEADREHEPYTAAWLEFDLLGTDGSVTNLRSDVFDRIGIAGRVAGDAATAEVAPLEVVAGEYADLGAWWQVGILLDEVSSPEAADPGLDLETLPGIAASLDSLLRLFAAVYRDMGGRADGPIILLAGLSLDAGPDGRWGEPVERLLLDALHVPGAAPSDPESAARDAQAVLGAESLLMDLLELGSGTSGSALVFSGAQASSVPLVLITPGDLVDIPGASVEAVARMTLRLDAGHRLLVPASAPSVGESRALAWWVIDPRTGAVRDEHETGRHTAVTENQAQLHWSVRAMQHMRKVGCAVVGPVAIAGAALFLVSGGTVGGDAAKFGVKVAEAREKNRRAGEVARQISCGK